MGGPGGVYIVYIVFYDECTLELRMLYVMDKWIDSWEMEDV
jgi:hypothetical protein